ncbi:hypothetical protein BL253_29285 [Pseudofrankia asymbiotica]|uniref:Protein kinase domain-containing protein n=1 Tax=Pseudofrankia asymbiotica TaxID=1834516 RepID=A0A1V2I3D3_9ACTN|nr:hypothetical protein BL253_29285 [Pseudofrankia asymbiotica]
MSGNAPTPLSAADPRRLGPYEIIGRLGQGGMGTVFLGRSPEGTPVAIKVIKPELAEAPEFRGRFRREAESARRVRRFTTAAVLDADPDGPNPYLVTEYVEGPTLSKMVARRGPMRPADLEQLALSVATALSAIHAAGIVHRDLTPANVLLSPVGPKVIDFGLARDFEGSGEFSRTARHAIGTPGYMAPEQILDSPVTSAADIFAWGAITIFAATGRAPFGEGRIEALLYRILYEPANIDGVPAELAPLVDAALQKEPERRPTAEALRAALMSGGDLVPGAAASAAGLAAPPASGREAGGEAGEGSRRRRGHLFSRAGRGPAAEEPPVTATPGSSPRSGPASVATGLLTPPPATTSRPPATTSRAPSTPGPTATPGPAATPGRTATPASPPPAPPGSAGPAARSGGPVSPPSRGPGAPRSQPPASPAPGGPPGAPLSPVPVASRGPEARSGAWSGPGGGPAPTVSRQAPPTSLTGGAGAAGGQPDEGHDGASQRPGRRKALLVIAGLVVLAVAAVTIPLAIGSGGGDGGGSAANRAELSTGLAQQAAAVRAGDPAKAKRLSLAAYRIAPTEAASAAMIASFTADSWAALPGSAAAYTGDALSADGRLAAATDNAGHLRLWDLSNPASPTQVADVPTSGAGAGPTAAGPRFLPAGGLVTGGETGHTWDLTDPHAPNLLAEVAPQVGQVVRLALSGNGKLLATTDMEQQIDLWDVSDPAKPRHLRPLRSTGLTTDVALSPDGRTLAIAGVGGTVSLRDITDPMNPVDRGQTAGGLVGQVNAVAFLPDGKHLVTGNDDATVRLWDVTDLANPKQVGQEWRGHKSGVLDVVPVGRTLVASTDASGALLGWDLGAGSSNPTPVSLDGQVAPRYAAADGGGKWLLSAPADASAGEVTLGSTDPAQLVKVACGTPANRMSATEWTSLITGLAYEDPCAGR